MKYEKERNRKGTDDGKQIASFYGRGENNRKTIWENTIKRSFSSYIKYTTDKIAYDDISTWCIFVEFYLWDGIYTPYPWFLQTEKLIWHSQWSKGTQKCHSTTGRHLIPSQHVDSFFRYTDILLILQTWRYFHKDVEHELHYRTGYHLFCRHHWRPDRVECK